MGMESVEDPQGRMIANKIKDLSPDEQLSQLQQYVGVVPLYKLFAVQQEVNRLKQSAQPQMAPQQQTTVAQDLDTELAQLEKSRGMGIAALPNPAMENAEFADGGIVAFRNGGPPVQKFATGDFVRSMARGVAAFPFKHPWLTGLGAVGTALWLNGDEQPEATAEEIPLEDLTPEMLEFLRNARGAGGAGSVSYRGRAGIPSGEDPGKYYDSLIATLEADRAARQAETGDIGSNIESEMELYQKYGIGEAGKKYAEQLQARQEALAGELESQKWMDWVNFFGDMGERAGQPGATFLGSAAGAMGTLAESRAGTMADYVKRRDAIADAMFANEVETEGLSKEAIKAGREKYRDQLERYDEISGKIYGAQESQATARADLANRRFSAEAQAIIASIQQSGSPDPIKDIERAAYDAMMAGKEELSEKLLKYVDLFATSRYGAVGKQAAKNELDLSKIANSRITEVE